MRDPLEFNTRKGTPWIVVITRILFAAYFAYAAYAIYHPPLPVTTLDVIWVLYLLVLYLLGEKLYAVFRRKNIDMSFAFPILLAMYLINLISLLLGGQEALPIMNRIEHFASFILIAYVISVFFSAYLPPTVLKEHPYYTALVILAITAFTGVGNELFELFFDVAFGTKHIGEHFDTALDLLMNTLGSGLLLGVQLLLTTDPPQRASVVAAPKKNR